MYVTDSIIYIEYITSDYTSSSYSDSYLQTKLSDVLSQNGLIDIEINEPIELSLESNLDHITWSSSTLCILDNTNSIELSHIISQKALESDIVHFILERPLDEPLNEW